MSLPFCLIRPSFSRLSAVSGSRPGTQYFFGPLRRCRTSSSYRRVPIQTSAVPVPDDVAHYSRDAIRKSRHANWTWVPFWQEHNKLIDGQTRAAGSGGGWKILRASDYYNGMKRKLFKTHKDRWEQGLAALSKFRKRKRHCCPSRHHLEGKFKLGRWVNTQRYLKDDLSVERKKRLDAIGFVWNWRDDRWEQGFAALLTFKRREAHCRV